MAGMRRRSWLSGSCLLWIGLSTASPASAIGLQVDDFEDGTTQGWRSGMASSTAPANVADGGPQGNGDAFLRIQGRGGFGTGSKPTAINSLQWTGNYTSAGVVRISADLRNAGATDLSLRLQITRDLTAGGQSFVTAAVMLPAGSGWVRASWQVDAASLIPLSAGADAALALTQVGELRIFHNPNPTSSTAAPALLAEYGVDNLRAEGAAADRDGDGVSDAADVCPFFPDPQQLDGDGNGRGNLCECGDQNGDGTVDVLDLVAINLAIFSPAQRTPLCDANADAACTVADIVSANVEIFSAGNTSICERQPVPGP
jgi:hypothetical protein